MREQMHVRIVPMTGDHLDEVAELERICFRTHGILLDCSRTFVVRPDYFKRWLRRLALLGYNMAMLYTKDAYQVPPERVAEYVFGYTILNDVTARELNRHKQNYFMKSLDGTCPLGPWIVTADEIAYPPRLNIRLSVNGEPRQNGNTGDMIFGVTEIVSELSRGVTLPAGVIIATGSPTGIGFGMNPPVYLRDGDVVTCEIDGIGRLENTVRD